MPNKKTETQTDGADTPSAPPEPSSAPPLPKHMAATIHQDVAPDEIEKDDPEIDKAVDDITAHEADEVLAAEDAELAHAFDPDTKPQGFRAKVKALAVAWWRNKKLRYGTFAGLAALVVLLAAIPQSRYFILNTSGIRSSATVIVLDSSTQQPLKNVEVQLANQNGKTDSSGTVKLSHLKLGATKLTISRRAFASVSKKVTVGWGSNPLGSTSLTPTGSQYTFEVTDFLSGKPINKAEASANEADAVADDKGQLVLTVDATENNDLSVVIKAEGYREVTIPLSLDDKSVHKAVLVPAQKHAFVSKRSGKYDLYTIDVDGTNEKVVLAGSGTERDDISVVPHPTKNAVALVSTRDNNRNKDGYLLSTLNIIDTKSGQRTQVTQSEKIQVIDWVGDRLVFVQVAAGASANDPRRQRLISYDYANNSQKELASSNYFYDLLSAGGVIYYSTSDSGQANQAGFYKVNPDGANRVTILNKEVWNIFRTQYDHLSLSVGQDWYDYKIGEVSTNKMVGPPANQQNRVYQDDSDRKNSLWVDSRDGKGVLLKYDITSQKDTILKTQSGLSSPMYWLNNHYAVYRIHTDQEIADYVINLDGGQPRKITDVTNTSGLGQWYYYQ